MSSLQELAKLYAYAELFLSGVLPCGVNLMDYINLLHYFRTHARGGDVESVPNASGTLLSMDQLAQVLLEARRNLVDVFASSEKYSRGITLEDIYLINMMAYGGYVQPVLKWSSLSRDMQYRLFQIGGTQETVALLGELGTLAALSPCSQIASDWFCAIPVSRSFRKDLSGFDRLLKEAGQVDQRQAFRKRVLEVLTPELDRFTRWQKALRVAGWNMHAGLSLPEIGFSPSLIAIATDPKNACATFVDTGKNWETSLAYFDLKIDS